MKKALLVACVIAIAVFVVLKLVVRSIQGPELKQGETDLRFTEVSLEHEHEADLERSLPFMGMSAVDIDGDGVDEVFVGGGRDQADSLFRFTGSGFTEIGDAGFGKAAGDATFGAASLDATGDGREDLFVARESGVYFYENTAAGAFRGKRIEFDMDEATTPLSIALGDIDLDGDVDLYVSGYIRVTKMEGETNFDATYGGVSYLLMNEGDSTWVDRTVAAGVYRRHNTFTALFVDLDGDAYPELVVAEDTGVVETWRNQGDGTFERTENPSVHSYPMGLAAGDLDGDADMDLFFSNVGSTLPEMMLRGNLPKDEALNMDYMLFLNDGEMGFTDVAAAAGVARLGFGWGVNACDFDNDGRLDLYVAQNYVKFPGVRLLELYPGRLMLQGEGFHFTPVERVAGLSNQNFGITQVISDFNQDGWPDIVLGNVDGPVRAFLSEGGDEAWLQVRLPDGAAWLHTRVTVTASDGRKWTRQSHASEGLASDSTDLLLFGLGDVEGEVSVEIAAPGKPSRRLPGVPVRTVLDVVP